MTAAGGIRAARGAGWLSAALLAASGVVSCRADGPPMLSAPPSLAAPPSLSAPPSLKAGGPLGPPPAFGAPDGAVGPPSRVKVQSYQNYETSERGPQLAVTPHLSWQLQDDLELSVGPTFYSDFSSIASPTFGDLSPDRSACAGLDRTDVGVNLGYYREFGRLNLGLAAGMLSTQNPDGPGRLPFAVGTFSAGYRLSPRFSLFGELYRNWGLGQGSRGGTLDGALYPQPGQTILTLGVRYNLRENESVSFSLSAAPHQGSWLRVGAMFRF